MFVDRKQAGRALAAMLLKHFAAGRWRSPPLVLALPRGGVPVGYEVSQRLGCPLDVWVVRKLGTPGEEELAMGAIASGGVVTLNQDIVSIMGIAPSVIQQKLIEERKELQRREKLYRGSKPLPQVTGKCAILVDDGLATGSTMKAAVMALRLLSPDCVVIAAPVGAKETVRALERYAEVVCVDTPNKFYAVGQWYQRFPQTTDVEVRALLGNGTEMTT